jgi:hypothetical protein
MKFTRLIGTFIVSGYFIYYATTYTQWHFIDSVNLIFHEAGHTMFYFFGQFISVAAGSGMQIALPLLFTAYFYYRGDKTSSALCLMWAGQNILNVSVYAKDAIGMQLELLGGDAVIHDWNYLLSTLNVLQYAPQISAALYSLGMVTIIGSIGWAIYAVTRTSPNASTQVIEEY